MKKIRRKWWELYPRTKEYVERWIKKPYSIRNNKLLIFLLKNRDFLCFWYDKSMPAEERLHHVLIEAMHRDGNALSYVTLEIERRVLRSIKRIIPLRWL